MTDSTREQQMRDFVSWVEKYITGDEKGQGQLFLDRFLKAFGWGGVQECGATLETRVRREGGKGTGFADLVWKPRVLIEMKRRGENLAKHYRQAFEYWMYLVPNRPRYVVLCNFDEFWIYDFETQLDVPVDKVSLVDLPTRFGALAFLFRTEEKPVFGDDHKSVTAQAANRLAGCFTSLINRGVERPLAQRFILQTLVALFSEDIGLIDRYFVLRLLEDCKKPADTYDLLGGMFAAMNSQKGTPAGRYKGIPYFNGGLFADPARVELTGHETTLLEEAAKFDWSKVRPEIFGTLFEHSLDARERHSLGAHFTSPIDIMKIVNPTIVVPWKTEIERADTQKRLYELLNRMQSYRVLDPACGSGNFLYIAYRELKRLEARIHERINELSKKSVPEQRVFGFVTAKNFFGMDINPFAVELAKVTMMIGRKLAIDELHITEEALPLDNLDSNFRTMDALLVGGQPSSWPNADAIIGNPPFIGAKRMKPERGDAYVNLLRQTYPEVPGMADYCVYWFRKAHDSLPACTVDEPLRGRAGLVGTQNIRNNESRVGGLGYIVHDGTIIDAVDNQPWGGEAQVNVSIVNWVKTQEPTLLPKVRRLWKIAEPTAGDGKRQLVVEECDFISASLTEDSGAGETAILPCNQKPQRTFQGMTPGYSGFVLSPEESRAIIAGDPRSAQVIRPYMIGRELTGRNRSPKRFIIDFDAIGDTDINTIQRFPGAYRWVLQNVLPDVERKYQECVDSNSGMAKARKDHLGRWWTFWARRSGLRGWMGEHRRIIAASRTQRWPFIFEFISTDILPGDKLQLFAFDDDYSFGILQSATHCEWYRRTTSRLKVEADFNYSSDSVFDRFPWPQAPTAAQIASVAEAARELRAARTRIADEAGMGFRDLYTLLAAPGKNELRNHVSRLDEAVFDIYGFKKGADIFAELVKLNAHLAHHPLSPMFGPGVPLNISSHNLISDSCLTGD